MGDNHHIMIHKCKLETLKIKKTRAIKTKSHSHQIVQKITEIKFKIREIVVFWGFFFILVFFFTTLNVKYK